MFLPLYGEKPRTDNKGIETWTAPIYLLLRYGATPWLDSLGPWTTVLLEACFVTGSLLRARREWRRLFRLPSLTRWLPALALAAGAAAAAGARAKGLPLPFDLRGAVGILSLLVMAPVLEELVFRFFLWRACVPWAGKLGAWVLTTLLFAYSHWHPGWWVPAEWHGFLAYQAAYTLGLGAACGAIVWRHGSVTGAMLVHAGFNFGFWVGAAL